MPGQSHTLLSTKLLLMVHPGVPPSSGQMKGSVTTPGPKQRWLKNWSKAGSRHRRSGHASGLTGKGRKRCQSHSALLTVCETLHQRSFLDNHSNHHSNSPLGIQQLVLGHWKSGVLGTTCLLASLTGLVSATTSG